MKKTIDYFWICLLISVLLTGCGEKEHGIASIPEQLKAYSLFQLGSYWVYKNERTGKPDSVFLITPPQDRILQSGDGPDFEVLFLTYDSSLISKGGVNWDEYWLSFKNKYGGTCLKAESFEPGYVYAISNGTFKNIGNFDSLEINNKMFYHVMNTRYSTVSFDRDTLVYTFYLARSVGLIKFNFRWNSNDTTWSLLRYHAVI